MSSRWLKLLETHVEKGILGLAAVALLAMLYLYLIRSPNVVEYGGEKLGPGKLCEAIREDALKLEQIVRSARVDDPKVDDFSEQLKESHTAGIFASASAEEPALPSHLRLAATYGGKIEVPGLEQSEDAAGTIVLVTPLKPSQPKLRTGRSLAVREQLKVAGLEGPPETTPPEEASESVEVAWVSVAAYFNKKAQYNDTIKAGYAPYRSKAYVVGVEAQRQEVLSDGEFSDWEDVEPGMAMPRFELPEPVFDDVTEELGNKNDIRETFASIKEAQPTLMQPSFYTVEDGDFWEIPPLAGYEDQDEEEEAEEDRDDDRAIAGGRHTVGLRSPGAITRPRSRGGGRTSGRGRPSGATRGGGGAITLGGGSTRTGGGGAGAAARSEAREKAEARKEIRRNLSEAKKLLGHKEYGEARDLARRIMDNEHATAGDIQKAKKVVKAAERFLERESGHAGGAVMVGGRRRFPGGGGRLASAVPRAARGPGELITNPETGEPAVWFHDDTVEAGKTYRYRLRVKLWNRYVGRLRAVRDPEDAKRTVVAGEWSFPSEPVTVTPSTYFFVTGSRPPETANVDVWKWREGRWIKQRFDVSVGDVIGGLRNIRTGEYDEDGDEIKADVNFSTGVVVLDLRFDQVVEDRWPGRNQIFTYRDRTSTIMTYLDPADGQVKERVLIFDRGDPKKKELDDQAW